MNNSNFQQLSQLENDSLLDDFRNSTNSRLHQLQKELRSSRLKSRPDSKWKLDIRTSIKAGEQKRGGRFGRMLGGDSDSCLSEDL
jgi:hypothetical protein